MDFFILFFIAKCGPSILNATKKVKTLTSPDFPNKYPPNIKCSWLISTQNPADRIELHFTNFSLSGNREHFLGYGMCDGDRVEIAEDPNRQIITEGFGPQAVYNSPRKSIFLVFVYYLKKKKR